MTIYTRKITSPTHWLLSTSLVLLVTVGVSEGHTQSPAKSSAPTSNSSTGFSIETEMLTYRALESNAQALACDIAGAVHNAKPDFTHPAKGAACSVSGNSLQPTMVLLPFEKTELEQFAVWQMAMIELAELQSKASAFGCPAKSGLTARAGISTASLSSFLSASPAGPPLAMAETVLQLLSSEESSTSVGGNIGDLAFMNSVARQLRALQISVVSPSSYGPESLDVPDDTSSPFLASKRRTLLARGCLSSLKPTDQNAADVKATISEIDAYLATLESTEAVQKPKASSTTAAEAAPPASGTGTTTPTSPSATSSTTTGAATLTSIFHADELARRLGYSFNAETGKLNHPPVGSYILMVKALESGGSVTGKTTILGTRLRYSGGSVGTFALFTANGDLACSGNVFDYAGSVAAKHFERDLANVRLDPAKQVMLQTGACALPEDSSGTTPVSNPIQ